MLTSPRATFRSRLRPKAQHINPRTPSAALLASVLHLSPTTAGHIAALSHLVPLSSRPTRLASISAFRFCLPPSSATISPSRTFTTDASTSTTNQNVAWPFCKTIPLQSINSSALSSATLHRQILPSGANSSKHSRQTKTRSTS